MNESAFPDQFHWGAATSAYQIEGAVHEDGRGESVWDRFVQTRGVIAGGGTGEVACDHYHRFIDDIAIMSQIGLNAYRLSLSWPRILPDGWGRVNNTGLDFYDKLIDELLAKGIQPCPTLFHWDLPSRLEDSGGWLTRDAPKAFEEYADLVTRKLGDRVKRWTTINEPWTLAVKGYGQGVHAPGHRNWGEVPVVGHHLLLAHGLAIRAIRGNVDLAIGGIGLPLAPVFA
ncbi:MAG: glycoside hydrolase family 1 protein, partial [Thermomicrobiales bacterium]